MKWTAELPTADNYICAHDQISQVIMNKNHLPTITLVYPYFITNLDLKPIDFPVALKK